MYPENQNSYAYAFYIFLYLYKIRKFNIYNLTIYVYISKNIRILVQYCVKCSDEGDSK